MLEGSGLKRAQRVLDGTTSENALRALALNPNKPLNPKSCGPEFGESFGPYGLYLAPKTGTGAPRHFMSRLWDPGFRRSWPEGTGFNTKEI